MRGEKSEATDDEDAHFYVRERMDKQFERVFVLPPEVDMNKAAATLNEGVLEVRVPKIERVSPRKVGISSVALDAENGRPACRAGRPRRDRARCRSSPQAESGLSHDATGSRREDSRGKEAIR